MPHRVGDRNGRALRHAEQREPGKTCGIHNGFKIGEPGLERNVRNKAVGQSTAALILSKQREVPAELGEPRPPDDALPVVLDVREPVGGTHDGRPLANPLVCEAHAVRRTTEADVLR